MMADSILKESLVGELVVAERICQECTQEFQNFKVGLMELSEAEFFSDIQRNHLYSQPEPSQENSSKTIQYLYILQRILMQN